LRTFWKFSGSAPPPPQPMIQWLLPISDTVLLTRAINPRCFPSTDFAPSLISALTVQSEIRVTRAKNIFSSKPILQGLAKQLFTSNCVIIYVPTDSQHYCQSANVRCFIKS
jgi:hypothetical protein